MVTYVILCLVLRKINSPESQICNSVGPCSRHRKLHISEMFKNMKHSWKLVPPLFFRKMSSFSPSTVFVFSCLGFFCFVSLSSSDQRTGICQTAQKFCTEPTGNFWDIQGKEGPRFSALGKRGRTQMGPDGFNRILTFRRCQGTGCTLRASETHNFKGFRPDFNQIFNRTLTRTLTGFYGIWLKSG